MEEDSKIKLKGNSEKNKYCSNEKKSKKKGKTKINQFRNFFQNNSNKIIKGDFNPINKKENDNKEVKKVRNPGVDLVRII